jgi:hypothetical protein
VWIRQNQFIFHLQVSWCTCGTIDSYHLNTGIINGEVSNNRASKFVFEMIKNMNVIFGKPTKGIKRKKSEKPPNVSPFKKQPIFFRYLPYWKEFKIGHAIDTMHVEKGVFGSTIGFCWTSQVRQRMNLVPVRTFKLLK